MISPIKIGIVSAAVLFSISHPAAKAADFDLPLEPNAVLVSETTLISACGKLFKIDSNADGMTAAARAKIVQHNLDNALVAAKDRSPSAVQVRMVNRNPVVTLDNYHVVTADGNSATRNRMTQMQLAQKWADSIRLCLADASAIDKYISLLTGRYPERKVATTGVMLRDEVAVALSEMLMPISLSTPISTETAQVGDRVEAVISHDVPLKTTFTTYLPAGTLVIGEIADAKDYTSNNFCGKDGFTVNFFEMKTPDGKRIPIDAHVYGGVNTWRQIKIKPLFAECCKPGTTVQDFNSIDLQIVPAKGYIVGGWKGASVDEQLTPDDRFPRLVFNRRPATIVVPSGEPMLLQLSATTVIAVSGRTM